MSISKLTNDFEHFYSFRIDNAELGYKMPNYRPRYLATEKFNDWVEPVGDFYPSQNYSASYKLIPDITVWTQGVLVLSPKAKLSVGEFIGPYGEFLPVGYSGQRFFLFNPLNVISENLIDRSRSVDDPYQIGALKGVIFEESKLNSVEIFKSPTDLKVNTYCTAGFKSLVNEKGLSGLVFQKV